MNGINKVLDLVEGQTNLAKKLTKLTGKTVNQGTVAYWPKIGYVPEKYRHFVYLAANKEVPLADLEPIYWKKSA